MLSFMTHVNAEKAEPDLCEDAAHILVLVGAGPARHRPEYVHLLGAEGVAADDGADGGLGEAEEGLLDQDLQRVSVHEVYTRGEKIGPWWSGMTK
jgi:hypothetical protein